MDTLTFWLPLFLLFASALVGAVLKRRACDHCLKKFHDCRVTLGFSSAEWIDGKLSVFAQGVELSCMNELKIDCGEVASRILHPTELEEVSLIVRKAPDPDTKAGVEWKRERERLLHPPLFRRIKRVSLNTYNMLRDSFGQALKAILGSLSRDTRLGKTKDADKRLQEMQSSLTGLVPNAWEPILEKYRGKRIAVERKLPSGMIWEAGILEDYSSKYLLVRDVDLRDSELVEHLQQGGQGKSGSGFDLLYSRNHTVLRFVMQNKQS